MFIERLGSAIIYIIPFLLSIAGYYWVFTKAIRLENSPWKYVAFIIWGGGCLFTAWELYNSFNEVFSSMNFNFMIIMTNCVILTVTAVVIALGEKN